MQEARDPTTERRAVGIRLLEAQPDLAEGLSPEEEADARRHVVAVLEDVPAGPWEPTRGAGGGGGGARAGGAARRLRAPPPFHRPFSDGGTPSARGGARRPPLPR